MAYTEFCVRSGGSNLNAGTRTGNSTEPGTAADLTYASGNWIAATGIFTVASGDPAADGVAVGDFASVYANGSTVTGFVGRVTARTTTTITVSLTVKHGTAPADGTGNRTLKIGGAWAGPSAAVTFPSAIILGTAVNLSSHPVRVNFKTDQTLATTAVNTYGGAGPYTLQGYTTSYGGGGRLQWDGGTLNASRIILSCTGADTTVQDMELFNNGATGSASGFSMTGARSLARRLVVRNVRGVGFITTVATADFVECECYAWNQSATSGLGGFQVIMATSCLAHDPTGMNTTPGFQAATNSLSYRFDRCIAYNVNQGFRITANTSSLTITRCDVYNATHGVGLAVTSASPTRVYIENTNFLLCASNRLLGTSTSPYVGLLVNCGGATAGIYANGADSGVPLLNEIGAVTYGSGVRPWSGAGSGDFTINNAAAKGAGRGTFLQLSGGPTLSHPDLGAAQSLGSPIINRRRKVR